MMDASHAELLLKGAAQAAPDVPAMGIHARPAAMSKKGYILAESGSKDWILQKMQSTDWAGATCDIRSLTLGLHGQDKFVVEIGTAQNVDLSTPAHIVEPAHMRQPPPGIRTSPPGVVGRSNRRAPRHAPGWWRMAVACSAVRVARAGPCARARSVDVCAYVMMTLSMMMLTITVRRTKNGTVGPEYLPSTRSRAVQGPWAREAAGSLGRRGTV